MDEMNWYYFVCFEKFVLDYVKWGIFQRVCKRLVNSLVPGKDKKLLWGIIYY